jgi:hypothetical protein
LDRVVERDRSEEERPPERRGEPDTTLLMRGFAEWCEGSDDEEEERESDDE